MQEQLDLAKRLQNNNTWEAARELCRHFFHTLNPSHPEALPAVPPVLQGDDGWSRRRDAQTLVRLWRLAYRDPPRRITKFQCAAILEQLDELEQRIRAGRLVLQYPAVPPTNF